MSAGSAAGSDGPGIMLVAGEASGDLHGATLCGALTELAPGWRLFGMAARGWRQRAWTSSST